LQLSIETVKKPGIWFDDFKEMNEVRQALEEVGHYVSGNFSECILCMLVTTLTNAVEEELNGVSNGR
jgi:hypothetical protein